MPSRMPVGIEVVGLEELDRRYKKIGKNLGPELRSLTQEAILYVHSQVPPYPPARAGSQYRRTGTLGRTITTKVIEPVGRGIYSGIIGTNTRYAPWVISDEVGANQAGPQAWFHRGIWYTLQEVVERASREVRRIYIRGVRRLLRTVR